MSQSKTHTHTHLARSRLTMHQERISIVASNEASSYRAVGDTRSEMENASGIVGFVARPVQEIQSDLRSVSLLKLFWEDMERRERTGFHQGTLILGVAQAVLVVAYCISLEVHSHDVNGTSSNYRYRNYMVVEVLVAGLAQAYYSVRGICLENSPMLLVANVNCIFLAIRMGLTVSAGLQTRIVDLTFTAVSAVITVMHVAISFIAWGGEFSRFMGYCIGTDERVQEMFREYQLMGAAAALDNQLCVMIAAAALFFAEPVWWHYVVVSVVMFLNLAMRSLTRSAVRSETTTPLLVAIAYDVAFAIFVLVALYNSSVIGVHIDDSCATMALFTAVVFTLIRFAKFATIFRCTKNFGKGMKERFSAQKSASEFLTSLQRRYKPRFLAEDAVTDAL